MNERCHVAMECSMMQMDYSSMKDYACSENVVVLELPIILMDLFRLDRFIFGIKSLVIL